MRSRLRRTGRRSAVGYWLSLPVLFLTVAAKPEDYRTRGESGDGPRIEWDTAPKAGWWQHECSVPGCKVVCQTQEKPTVRILCYKDHRPVKGVMVPKRG